MVRGGPQHSLVTITVLLDGMLVQVLQPRFGVLDRHGKRLLDMFCAELRKLIVNGNVRKFQTDQVREMGKAIAHAGDSSSKVFPEFDAELFESLDHHLAEHVHR